MLSYYNYFFRCKWLEIKTKYFIKKSLHMNYSLVSPSYFNKCNQWSSLLIFIDVYYLVPCHVCTMLLRVHCKWFLFRYAKWIDQAYPENMEKSIDFSLRFLILSHLKGIYSQNNWIYIYISFRNTEIANSPPQFRAVNSHRGKWNRRTSSTRALYIAVFSNYYSVH